MISRPSRALGPALCLGTVLALGGCAGNGAGDTPTTVTPTSASVTFLVVGNVHAGPTCPVERPDQPCADVPVRGTVSAWRDGQSVESTTTDAGGNYSLVLPSGRYELRVDTGAELPRCEPVTVEVVDGYLEADISCDTGIR
ncbi:MAG: hypothetical protein F2934_07045 [Actinobacteria bacterium]|uniref:Unannotated protein n=1 Tax=freshwater metagenome TaxID=449393 RepID=A0A6J7UF85_9ZZZZ|nr:hypothetical protein [Actinomycetota bacterium]MTB06870.1 hypothetical protein [Actinomycetota bacterium]